MTAERFVSGKRFNWQGSPFEVKRLLPGNGLNIENISTGAVQIVELSKLVNALFRGELEFEVRGRHVKQGDHNELVTESAHIALDDYPAQVVEIARHQLRPCTTARNGRQTMHQGSGHGICRGFAQPHRRMEIAVGERP